MKLPLSSLNVVLSFSNDQELAATFIPNPLIADVTSTSLDELPTNLAKEKNNEEQIKMCFEAYNSEHWITQFD